MSFKEFEHAQEMDTGFDGPSTYRKPGIAMEFEFTVKDYGQRAIVKEHAYCATVF